MKNIKSKIEAFFNAYTQEQQDLLNNAYQSLVNELNARRMQQSTHAGERLGKLYADELKCRIKKSWDLTKDYFEKHDFYFSEKEITDINQLIKKLIERGKNQLLNNAEQKLNLHKFFREYHDGIQYSLNKARNQLVSIIQSELNLFVKCKGSVSISDVDAIELKPNLFGIGININHIIKRIFNIFGKK